MAEEGQEKVDAGLKRIYLVDGTANLFRAFHAIRSLSSPSGRPTNATFGFTQMLRKLLHEETPGHLAVAFDRPEPTHRHELFPDYKANRQAPPEDLILQIEDVKRVCRVLGVPTVELPGWEADDLIGTLSKRAVADGFEVIVVASDKDLLQLVDDSTRVLNPVRGELIDAEGVRRTFGVRPEQVVDVLALMGDSSDNIPGVPGIGEKGAKELIARHGSLEACLEHVMEIPRRTQRENLIRYQDQALLSRELARIRLDAPVEWFPSTFERGEIQREEARTLFGELGFARILEEVVGPDDLPASPGEEAPPPSEGRVDRVSTRQDLLRLAEELSRVGKMALVPVLSSPEPMRADLVGLAIATGPGRTVYVPTSTGRLETSDAADARQAIELLRAPLESDRVRKIAEDLKTFQVALLRRDASMSGLHLDTTVAAYLLDPERREYGLGGLQGAYLGRSLQKGSGAARGDRRTSPMTRPLEEVAREAARDCQVLVELEEPLRTRLRETGLLRLYEDVESPLLSVLARMEWTGVRVDVPFLRGLSERWNCDLGEIEERIYGLAGERFNIHSPRQLRDVLFGKLHLQPGRKTEKEKSFSTGVDVLEDLAGTHPLPAAVLEYRSLAKLLSTYVEVLPRLVNPETGRVHASFNQAAAATGRLSSSNPNLQNIPIRTERGRQIRRAFVAEEGWRILAADYSQIELRVLAHLAKDQEMIRAFRAGEDIHARTASQIFGISSDLVTAELRRQAKAINFGIIYGMGPFRLGKELGVSTMVARRFIEQYFERFSGVKRYVEEVVSRAEREGRVSTLFGRIRPVPEIRSRNMNVRNQGIRVAVNTTIQGTAADLIKIAMVRLDRSLRKDSLRTRLIIQVHDELLLEAPEDEVEEAARRVREAMERCHPIDVPLVAEVQQGPNWLEISPVAR